MSFKESIALMFQKDGRRVCPCCRRYGFTVRYHGHRKGCPAS